MGGFVIRGRRRPDGPLMYVAVSGSESSYTRNLDRARRFPTREAAQRDACDNESVVPVDDHLQPYDRGR
jgi:hypothetical protein